MKRVVHILTLLLLTATLALADPGHDGGDGDGGRRGRGPDANGKSRQTRSQNGQYAIIIAGSFQGTGTATIGDAGLNILADVVTADGSHGQLSGSNLKIDGPYFSGSATAAGQQITIQGRLDAAKSSRLTAQYSGGTSLFGRIAGVLPTDSGQKDWKKPGE